MSMDRNDYRDRILADWTARYGHETLPEGDLPHVRETLVNFAAEILSASGAPDQRITEIISRYTLLVG